MVDGSSAPRRMEVRTRDRDVVADAINRIIAHKARVGFETPSTVDLAVRSTDYSGIGAFRVRLDGVRYESDVPPMTDLVGGIVTDGVARVQVDGFETELRSQDGLLYPEGAASAGEYGNTRMMWVHLPLAYVEGVAGLPGLRFEACTPVSRQMRGFWADTTTYLVRQLTAPGVDLSPLLVEQLRRLFATSALAVFPNTTMTGAYRPGPGRVPMAVVRRAVAYMEENASRPLTVAEIASAAGVGARGLQAAFRRHLDSTPLEHLRRIRLERVHLELTAAGAGVTVGEVARRWGFANPGRFAGQYRAAYGVSPVTTLHA
ncbi:helix-turn-helix domain-containing protein [Catenuloplanes sp. NPDC051500]|uniref:helix-turn-helix domain-containing protein n=1 Tax=Catenuloplanes sp. NPDC051500 TaxID=3363959 RepID=UPI00379765D6